MNFGIDIFTKCKYTEAVRFEWDEEKRLANVVKHRIDFTDACRLFEGPYMSMTDNRRDYGEIRSIAFGHVESRLIAVAFTKRDRTLSALSLRERQMTVKKRDLKKQSLTEWKRIDSMKDEDIDLLDIAELDDNFFKNAELVLPKPKVVVTLRVDADVMEWFRAKGKGYQTMMNAVLKGWVEQHRT